MPSNKFIQRFIILSTARTGSNYLMFLLGAHENIKMFGELFNLDTLTEEVLREALDNPVLYMNKRLNGPFSEEKTAVGFKLFYDHLTPYYFDKKLNLDQVSEKNRNKFRRFNDFITDNYSMEELQARFDHAWNYIISDKTIKVIHLRRKDKLGTLVSLKTALMRDEWLLLKDKASPRTPLQIEYSECLEYFQRIDENEQKHAALFGGHRKIELTYEELVENKDEVIAGLFDFLEVPAKTVSALLKKQIPFELPEVIVNYGELRERFEGTKWQGLFRHSQVPA